MKALIRKADGVLEQWVLSTDGYDLSLYIVRESDADPQQTVWNGKDLVPRAPTKVEQVRDAVKSDQLLARLETASPAELEAWLTANVTNMQSVRSVLKTILMKIRVDKT